MRYFFCIVFLFSVVTVHAQQQDSIVYSKFLFAHQYKKTDGSRLNNHELKERLLGKPAPAKYFRRHQREYWIGIAGLVSGILLANYGESPTVANRYNYPKKANPFIISGVAAGAVGVYLNLHSFHRKHQAVKAYNREIL